MAKRGPPPHAAPRHGIALMIGLSPFATEHEEPDEDHLGYQDEPEHDDTDPRFAHGPGHESGTTRKLAQKEVDYRASESCGNCAMYAPPDSCSIVKGQIFPGGVCDEFIASDGAEDDGEGGLRDDDSRTQA